MRPSLTVRRAGWGIADQAFSSLTNFALGVLVARTVDLASFGAFSLAFAAYLLVVSVTRGYPMDPLAIRYAAATPVAFRHAASAATGTVVVVGCVCGIALVGIGLATSGSFSESLLALGITFPGLLLQDAWRSTFFASGRGQHSFLNDVIWAAVEFPLLGVIVATGGRSVFWPVLVWGGSATFAALVGIVQASVVPRPWLALTWWREHTDLGLRFIAEALVRVVSSQIQLYGVGFVAGLTAVGALRAGQLLFGPVQVLSFGISMMAVPEGARALAISLDQLRRVAFAISGGLVLAALGWGVVVLFLPSELGNLLLRGAWKPAHSLSLPIMLATLGGTLTFGAGAAIRSLAAARRSLRATSLSAMLTLVLGISGAALGGASGSAWGLALTGFIGAAIWGFEARGAARDYRRERPPVTVDRNPPSVSPPLVVRGDSVTRD